MKQSKRYFSFIILFIGVCSLVLSCGQPSTIETESLRRQLLISDQYNADVVHDMLQLVYWYEENAEPEYISVANKVRGTLRLKEELGLKIGQEKSALNMANAEIKTYFDSVSAELLNIDSSYYATIVLPAKTQFNSLDNSSLDGKYHQLLKLSMLERKLFSIYRDSLGVGATFDIFYPCEAFRKEVLFANQKNQIVITPVAKIVDDYFNLTYSNSVLYKEGSKIPLSHSFNQLENAAIMEFENLGPGFYTYEVGVNKSPETNRIHYIIEKFELVEATNEN